MFKENLVPDDIPEVKLASQDLEDGRIWIVRLLVQAGLASSNGEGRRLIQQGGVRLDGEIIENIDLDWEPRSGAVLQVGKRRFARVVC